MPSGKIHDAFTFLLAVPVGICTYFLSGDPLSSVTVLVSFLFGGLMFGPDLDTRSTQYLRWGYLRILWFPYKKFFTHRSRFTHGHLLGALIRVIYFAGVITLITFLLSLVLTAAVGNEPVGLDTLVAGWSKLGEYLRSNLGEHVFLYLFLGVWLGASSHSIVDLVGTYLKTGKIGRVI